MVKKNANTAADVSTKLAVYLLQLLLLRRVLCKVIERQNRSRAQPPENWFVLAKLQVIAR